MMNINKFQELKSQLDNELQSANLMCIKPFLKLTSKKQLQEKIKHFPEWQSRSIMQAWEIHCLRKEWLPLVEKTYKETLEKSEVLETSIGDLHILINPMYCYKGDPIARIKFIKDKETVHIAYSVYGNKNTGIKYRLEIAKIEQN